jgi:parvulin-like peptidyl-prolyl isomerase
MPNTNRKIKTKKHLAREQREAKQTRLIIIGTIAIGVAILGLVIYGAISQFIIRPNVKIAQVGDTDIKVREFEKRVEYSRVQMLNQAYQYYTYYQQFGQMGQSFLETSQQIVSELMSPTTLGSDVLDGMIDDIIIRDEASARGITVSEQEIDEGVQMAFGFYPNGTPTPTVTATIQSTPTLSETQLSLVTSTSTPTETSVPTETPEISPTPSEETQTEDSEQQNPDETEVEEPSESETEDQNATTEPELSPTITLTPTITSTPTPYTTQVFAENINDFQDVYKEYNFDLQDLRELIELQLLREKLLTEVTADLQPVKDEVWARHILVETEEEALQILTELEEGGDFALLAAKHSTDESNKDSGGDLGWFDRERMVEEFSEAAFNLEIGEISDPIETSFGYHIIQVLGKRESQILPNEFEADKQEAFATWLTEIRGERDDIVIYDVWEEYVSTKPEVPQELLFALYQQFE